MLSFFILIFIVLLIGTAIRPIALGRFSFTMVSTPFIIFPLMFMFPSVSGQNVMHAIVGDGSLQPWKILIIFFGTAYIAISTDKTGLFEYIAYKIIQRTNGNGVLLFFSVYCLTAFIATVTSNDIEILTLTPIILYFGQYARLNVVPLLFAQFFATHTFSMLFLTGDPTNIIVATALNIDFLSFLRTMAFPTFVAAVVNMLLLWIFFRTKITRTYEKMEKTYTLEHYPHAVVSAFFLFSTLYLFGVSGKLGIQIWQIVLLFVGIFVLKDIVFGLLLRRRTCSAVVAGIPWRILPFILVLFILVDVYGRSDAFGIVVSFFTHVYQLSDVLGVGVLGAFLANIMNNQPMTVFMTQMLIHPAYAASASTREMTAYAIIIASNIGATFTIVGALAGIMWQRILRDKGTVISYMDFAKVGFFVGPITLLCALAALFV